MELRRPKWLVVFVKDEPDDKRALEGRTKWLEELLSKKPNTFTIAALSNNERADLKQIGDKKGVEGELSEKLNEILIDKIIRLKKDTKSQRVAVVLGRSDFGQEEAFLAALKDPLLSKEPYYVICWQRNFLSMTKKLGCLDLQCGVCSSMPCICEHSCFPKLLWLLFDRDERVKDELIQLADNDAEFR